MAFGFSVGDFIAVGKLIKDIKDCLQSVGGAKSQYQAIVRELDILDKALKHVDRLKAADEKKASQLGYIKFAAISCRYSLQEFLEEIKEYNSSLGVGAKTSIFKKTVRKFQWSFGRSEDLGQLQMYLNTHIGTINMLLEQYGLEQMASFGIKVDEGFRQVNRKLEENQAIIRDVKKDTSDISSSLGQLFAAIGQHRLSIEQVHTSIAEIVRSVRDLDTGMTYLQRPFQVEDALGFKYAIPSELGYGLLDTYIRYRFKQGAGSQDVALGNYEFSRADCRWLTITASSQLTPGTRIVMAVIVEADMKKGCPTPGCPSRGYQPHPGGGWACSHCGVWLSLSTKRRQEIENRVSEVDELSTSIAGLSMNDPVQPSRSVSNIKDKRSRGDSGNDYLLKNVTITDPYELYQVSTKDRCLVM